MDSETKVSSLGNFGGVVVDRYRRSRASFWGSILGGAAVTITTHITLGLLGAGIGLGLIPKTDVAQPTTAMAIGAAVWWLISTIVAVFAGAYTAGVLANPLGKRAAALHGLATWGVSSFVWFAAMSLFAGGMLGGAFGVLSKAAAEAAPVAVREAADEARNGAFRPRLGLDESASLDRRDGLTSGAVDRRNADGTLARRRGLGTDLEGRIGDWLTTPGEERVASTMERQELVRTLADRGNLSEADARERLEALEARANRAQAKAKEAAEKAAKVAAGAALWGFFGLLLAAGAACTGGISGARCAAKDAPREDVVKTGFNATTTPPL